MPSARGPRQTPMGIVMFFSLLLTIAAFIPCNGLESAANPNQLRIVVNGVHYILDPSAKLDEDQTDGRIHIIHSTTQATPRRLNIPNEAETQPRSSLRAANNPKSSKSNEFSSKKAPLLPGYAWMMLVVYHIRRLAKKRRVTYDEDFFDDSGLNANLEYGMREFEDDFLSVSSSTYGSMSRWSGDELDKFDVSSQNSEDLLDV